MTTPQLASGPGAVGGIRAIAAREISAYFDSKIAYVYTIAFCVLANLIFMNRFFSTGLVDMTYFFDRVDVLMTVFLPAVTMRLWAEERKTRTIELLLTLPVSPMQAVLGKYIAALGLFGLFLVGTLPIVFMLQVLGDPDIGRIVSGYLGVGLLGALFLAVGIFVSSIWSDQIVTFVVSVVIASALLWSGNENTVAVLDGWLPALSPGTLLYEWFSVAPHYDAFVRGLVALPSVVYFAGLSAVFLWVTALVLEWKRE